MAKRKRLSPLPAEALPHGETHQEAADGPGAGFGFGPAPETKSMFPLGVARNSPPIARIAAEAAASAALEDMAAEIRRARAEGRLVQALPLAAIDAGYLVRDRLASDPEAQAALTESLRARGQQMPIEVVDLGAGRFGLISGWRRLQALQALLAETGEPRFGVVQALLRQPETASDAYRAMVEENEIRAGLSYYERARIVARCAELGVYPDPAAALRELFANASRAKRSKIGSFLAIVRALDGRLRFPSAIPERLGLALSRALESEPALGPRLADRLRKTPAETAPAEIAALERALKAETAPPAPPARQGPEGRECAPGVFLSARPGAGLQLAGPGVDEAFRQRLEAWLAALRP